MFICTILNTSESSCRYYFRRKHHYIVSYAKRNKNGPEFLKYNKGLLYNMIVLVVLL